MGQIIKIPTSNMSESEWQAARRQSVGGSDAATVLGLNPYASPYSLWAEKTGSGCLLLRLLLYWQQQQTLVK